MIKKEQYEEVLRSKQFALSEKKILREAIEQALDNWDYKEIALTILTEAYTSTAPKPVERPKDCGCD